MLFANFAPSKQRCETRYKWRMEKHRAAALFDLDGVVFDTEPQYTLFWGEKGKLYHPEIADFEQRIKGQTLVQIFDGCFAGQEAVQQEIVADLKLFESQMDYEYVAGIEDFLKALREEGIATAVVTSSNEEKMRNVYGSHPEFKGYFDRVLTSEFFPRSKPDPDCYLIGAEVFGLPVSRCVVFEDSFNGLKAGRSAGMSVVGLSTTNAPESICGLCEVVIPDFRGFGVEKMLGLLA